MTGIGSGLTRQHAIHAALRLPPTSRTIARAHASGRRWSARTNDTPAERHASLIARSTACVSEPLLEAIQNGIIDIKMIPGAL
jgi:hypothetical protein